MAIFHSGDVHNPRFYVKVLHSVDKDTRYLQLIEVGSKSLGQRDRTIIYEQILEAPGIVRSRYSVWLTHANAQQAFHLLEKGARTHEDVSLGKILECGKDRPWFLAEEGEEINDTIVVPKRTELFERKRGTISCGASDEYPSSL